MCFFAACKKRSATEIWISFDSRWLRAVLGWPSIGGSPLFGAEKRWKDSLPFFICFPWLQQHAWLENTRSMFKSHWQHDCMVDGSWTYSLIPKIPVGTCSSFKPWLGLWEICTGSREFDRKISGRPADLPLNQLCNLDGSGMIWIYLSPKGRFFVFFRCSWVSLIFSSWSKPSEKESMVLSWHLVEMRLSSIVIGCSIINHPFWGTSGTSIYGNPQICWNIRPLDVSEEGGGTSAAYHFLEKAEGQKFRFQALQFAASRFVMVCLGNYPKVTSPFKFIYPQYIHILSACSRKVVRRATWLPRCIRYPNPSANLPKSGQHVAIPPRL